MAVACARRVNVYTPDLGGFRSVQLFLHKFSNSILQKRRQQRPDVMQLELRRTSSPVGANFGEEPRPKPGYCQLQGWKVVEPNMAVKTNENIPERVATARSARTDTPTLSPRHCASSTHGFISQVFCFHN